MIAREGNAVIIVNNQMSPLKTNAKKKMEKDEKKITKKKKQAYLGVDEEREVEKLMVVV